MNTKSKAKKADVVAENTETQTVDAERDASTELPKIEKHLIGYTVVVDNGKALKLSPKTQNHVFYQIAKLDADSTLHIRLSGNEGGGLHSKEWISVEAIVAVLDGMTGQPIKSTVLRSVFKGGSANNAAFLAAVMRSKEIGLLVKSDKSVFIHQLPDDYEDRKAALLNLA
ncbi:MULTISPECIES: hypothetical protein [unclassified Vibrio]|uniref:hypothetical protein n=1 Tax=unclassified Vibrio TaxID=2614977 RepID=UPI00355391A0